MLIYIATQHETSNLVKIPDVLLTTKRKTNRTMKTDHSKDRMRRIEGRWLYNLESEICLNLMIIIHHIIK